MRDKGEWRYFRRELLDQLIADMEREMRKGLVEGMRAGKETISTLA